jgi:hypothetical protein
MAENDSFFGWPGLSLVTPKTNLIISSGNSFTALLNHLTPSPYKAKKMTVFAKARQEKNVFLDDQTRCFSILFGLFGEQWQPRHRVVK